jgi:hypothetical protein
MKAAPITLHPTIPQTGVYGYLLWLRSAMPSAYTAVAQKVPAVASFEQELRNESGLAGCGCNLGDIYRARFSDRADRISVAGFGDYSAPSDLISDSSAVDTLDTIDVTATSEAGGAIDVSDLTSGAADLSVLSPDFMAASASPPIDTSIVDPPAPTLPPIEAPAATSAAGAVASSATMASSLPAIAAIVSAVAPVAVASLNLATAQTNASTVAKTQQAAQLQLQQALSGAAPYPSGVVQGANGAYIAAVAPASQNSLLSSTLGGIPVWILALGGVGAALLMME